MASADPGTLIKIADMAPPKLAPLLIPTRNAMALKGLSTKVRGIAMAMAMGPLSPGIAPTTMPTNTPNTISKKFAKVSASMRPATTVSIDVKFSRFRKNYFGALQYVRRLSDRERSLTGLFRHPIGASRERKPEQLPKE